MYKFYRIIGYILALGATVLLLVHRFSNPDTTEIRWFIEFWYIWLAWLIFVLVGGALVSFTKS